MSRERLHLANQRDQLLRAVRGWFQGEGFLEVDVPLLVPAPGMEPFITAFEVPFTPETSEAKARTLFLHTSPEYAMKRLLAEGFQRLFFLGKTFRNGEVARDHNPEFTMLEFYRAHADYTVVMDDLEAVIRAMATRIGSPFVTRGTTGHRVDVTREFERLTVREALRSRTGIDLYEFLEDPAGFAKAARALGVRVGDEAARSFDDVFFQLFLEKVEPTLGHERPTFLIDYPRSMASLARLKAGDPRVAERFELYVAGLELANGYSELNDAAEQRSRLVEEQALRRSLGRTVYPLDEAFLAAVGGMPKSGGVAVGIDRLVMLFVGARSIADVLLFPARDFLG